MWVRHLYPWVYGFMGFWVFFSVSGFGDFVMILFMKMYGNVLGGYVHCYSSLALTPRLFWLLVLLR